MSQLQALLHKKHNEDLQRADIGSFRPLHSLILEDGPRADLQKSDHNLVFG